LTKKAKERKPRQVGKEYARAMKKLKATETPITTRGQLPLRHQNKLSLFHIERIQDIVKKFFFFFFFFFFSLKQLN